MQLTKPLLFLSSPQNIFLQGQFLKLGLEWLTYTHENLDNKYDPLIRVFPRLTKCVFHKYGYSGSIETHDALCFLTCKYFFLC